MLPVEEIRGVPRVEGVGCKARERCKDRARPLPPIAEKTQRAERARSGWMRPYGRGVPPVEIEISMLRAWRLFAPWVAAFRAVGRAVRRAMKLRLGGELPAEPLRIRGSFRMAHVHRAIERQTNLSEHRAIQPKISVPFPERWVPDSFFFLPLPRFLRPQRAVIVAPSLDESQELAVGHVAGVDLKGAHVHFMRGELIVPTELVVVRALQPEGRPARGDFNHPATAASRLLRNAGRPFRVSLCREPVQHIGQRLDVHQPVFDGGFEHGEELRMPFGGPAQGARDGGVKLVAHPVVVALDLLSFRPVSGPIVGEPAAHRVNPEGQELVERRLKRTQPERALGQQIPVEGFHMPEVENNPVPLWNWSVVYRFRSNNAEKLVRAHARFRKPRLQVVTGADGGGKDSHGVFPFRFDAKPLRRMRPK